ncbi:auxin transport protein BIG [Tanacetum coccineum]
MAEPLAELVGTLFDDKATTASLRSHKLGLETLYTILKEGVENDNDKLGLTNTQIQSVVSVAYAIVSLTRSVTVEQVEPIVVAIMEKSLEFIIRCLESSVGDELSYIQVCILSSVEDDIDFYGSLESELYAANSCLAEVVIDQNNKLPGNGTYGLLFVNLLLEQCYFTGSSAFDRWLLMMNLIIRSLNEWMSNAIVSVAKESQKYITPGKLLEIALVDGTIKEADVSHPSSVNLLIDSLKSISIKSDDVDLQEHIECIIQGNSCSKEKKPVDRLLMTLASEWTQNDNMNSWTIGRSSHDSNKLVPLLQHWAVVHLGCIQRLVSYCARLVENLDKYDEKIDGINLRKRLSLCTRIFKLLASVTKDTPYVEYGAELMGSFACFTNVLPSLFRSGYEFATSNVSAEFSIENLVLLLLEAFLHLVHTIFCNSNVFQNILVCVIVSVVENLDVDVWRYDKSITNIKLPVAYFPRIVLYTLKLVEDIKKQQYQALELKGLHAANSGISTNVEVDSFLFGVSSGRISLVKAYTVEELLKVIFPTSKQWVDSLMHLAFFLHSEGVKMSPKLDRSYSSCTKASSTLEPDSTVCHEDEALFGDLFSEGGRSVGSVDGYDQSVIAASSVTNVNMPLHAASELFIFLKTSVFSREWNSSIYEDARKKLNTYHIDIILSVLSCQGCYAGDRTSDVGDRKYVHVHEVCYEVLHNLISFNALSESLEDYLVCKILTIENGSFIYNQQTLALLAHTLICRVDLSGKQLRTKVHKVFVEFVSEKVKSVCARCPSLKELIETLPSVFHIEILLMSFHLSSEEEKAVQANFIFSSIKTIEPLSNGFNSTQLSCWALLVSRLVLILRHMIFYPNVCPPTLLSELKSKLKEAPLVRSVLPGNVSNRTFWASTSVENMMQIFTIEGEVSSSFLNQLIDVTSFTTSACKEDTAVECLGLSWAEVCSSFSWILEFWRGKGASTMEDLVLERYIFMLCWDIPPMHTALDSLPSCSDNQTLDITSTEHLLYFGHSILASCGVAKGENFPKLVSCVLEQLQSTPVFEEAEELGWDFLRSGSWLSLVLSLLGAGNYRYCINNGISSVDVVLLEHTSRDAEFLTLAEKLVISSLNAEAVADLLQALSVLLRKYRNVYHKTLLSTFGDGQSSANKFSPLLLLKHTGFEKSLQDVLFEKSAFSPGQLESICELLPKLGTAVDKMAPGIWNKVFSEIIMHGFPCSNQVPSGFLLSSILSIKGIISVLYGLLKVIKAKGITTIQAEVRFEILESVLSAKTDRVFSSLHGQCDAIHGSLTESLEGLDYGSFFSLKNMYEFLRDINAREVVDSSVNECVVSKAVDVIDTIMKDPSRASVLIKFMSDGDVDEQMEDACSSQHGDLLVLINALDNCISESVNEKVLSFFVDLLSGDICPSFKPKLQKKFLDMKLLHLSNWLEKRLLGSTSEASGDLVCVNGSSSSLRESTMKFIMTIMSSPEGQSEELQDHIYKALLVSLDNAFMLYDVNTAKSYLNFVVQLSSGETSMKPLLEQTVALMKKLACDERQLQGLKYLFGFLGSMVSDFGSNNVTSAKAVEKPSRRSGSGLGQVASRSLGSRKHPDALLLSSNQEGASASLDCDATSADEDEDDGTSDGEVGSMDKDEFDDGNSERALASKVCTFTSSGSNFMEQHWYFCYTCDLTVSKGCCSVCAKVCHRGHRVVYSRSSRFFCDCGAGGVRGSSCQCLKPRKFTGGNSAPTRNAGNLHSFLPFTEDGDQLPDSESDVDEDGSLDMDNSVRLSFPREIQEAMPSMIKGLDVEDRVLELCSLLLPSVTTRRDSNLSKDKNISLGEDKVLSFSTDLLQLKKAYKSGSLDLKIKADYSNAKELKSHLASGSLVKSLLSVSTRGRLAVGEGDKVAIFDVGQLIGQATNAPVTADKANVKPLSKNVVRFEIVHLAFNPLVENYLAVAGYEDCQVLTVSHRGEVSDRLAIELALQGAYIRRIEWVPGSQVQLMVVTNRFVKIYDLSQDNISPMHYITLQEDTIVDATLAVVSQARVFLLVLSELGRIFRLELSNDGNAGAKTLKEVVETPGRETHAKGSSLYFSSTYKLLFTSYQDGTTLVGRLSHGALSLSEISAVYEDEQDGKRHSAGLHRFKELLAGSGLFVCFSSVKSNAALTVSIGEHEVLAQNMRNGVYSTSVLVGITAYKPLSKDKIHCLVLHDDGSLQIYTHVPVGVEAGANVIPDKVKKLGSDILNSKAYASLKPEFPLDFFEKTVCITTDVKLSGDAIRNGDSEGAKQSLASEDGFLESPTPAGFKVTVSNSNPDIVMVGFRVHVGNTSANHIPSDITIFQRVIKLDEGMRSWYDIPFTVAESLLADEEITISVGPTFNRSTLPRIDTLEIYGRAKDEFGWKEKMDAVLDMEARVLGSSSWVAGSGKKRRAGQAAPIDEQVVADGLNLLSRLYALCKPQGCSTVEEVKSELSKLKCKQLLETIFESDREPLLQAGACRVLQAVFPRKEIYYQVKDSMRLLGVVRSTSTLLSRLGVGGSTSGWIIEEFTAQMHAVSKIAIHRRSNLATFLETHGSEVVDGLMQVLWGILDIEQPETQTMNNIVIASVDLIYSYAECLVSHENVTAGDAVAPAVNLFKKLLFSSNEAVQTASSLAISSRLLQVPFPKQTMLGADDSVDSATSAPARADVASSAGGNARIMVEEDSITSSVQYCCDGCSTVPILRRRWHCTVCPDFDLCEACYEMLDADRLPPPHSRDHPMSAIPIEVESYGGEGNEMQFSTDDISDPMLLPVASDVGMPTSAPSIHVLETNESGEFQSSVVDPVTISASKRAINSLILSEFLKLLKGWMETTSGVRAIPVMQLFYRLSSAVGGPFVDSSRPESLDLEKVIKWFLDEISINKPFAAKSRSSFGEVTILVFMFFTLMLRNWHQPGGDGSAAKPGGSTDSHDKNTGQISPSTPVDDQEKNSFHSQLLRACGSLRQQDFINYLMDILQQLMQVFKSPSVGFDSSHGANSGSGCGALLTVRREIPAGNFSPFFSDSYAKSHRSDMFADYHRLLLENTFRLVYSLVRPEKHDKGVEKDKFFKIPSGKDLKLDGYQDVLCSYINNVNTNFVRRYARRLFLHLCGSKTHYYSIRDSWQFSSEVKKLYKHINKSGGFQSTLSYERSVKIVKCLSTMAEVASSRPRNWQKYCLRHSDVLRFLVSGVFFFPEECVSQALKLLNLSFYNGKDSLSLQKTDGAETVTGTSMSKSGQQSVDSKKKKKGDDGTESALDKSYMDMEPMVDIFADKGYDVLRQFVDCFLLEWNSSSVRVEAKCVLYGSWHHGKQPYKETMLAILLEKVKYLPMYGQNIIEYTELVTCLLGRLPDNATKQQSNEIVDRCLTSDVIKRISDTLHLQNELLANHPNSRIYNTLSGLVEFDGYYLESEPCVSCSCPELPYSKMKLESLKSETKFTDNRIIVKCTGSYTIQSVTMNVHDARKSKSVKVLNLYYNNRPVADLAELKNNWSLWKRAKVCHLAFNQSELKVDFPIPITACNFMIELDSFYENLQALSLEPLQCPRCSRPVTDRHGICSNCHENAYQCRQCRNINYENLDSFLCNECGYSKYGRFEFNFMAKPSFTFDNMENDDDMKRGLAAIESESENAHRRYQQLLGFKKPLLKIVSSIGENDMDSQQKDSVQQMMVSLPGPSCKINRKIALLGVLYGEKCKAAFDSVSKSVQTLQGLRRVLMNYLHQKHSDDSAASSRLVVTRSANSCYGCATVFVTQCLEVLQVLSKHPSSKRQLVASGILSELFENNIHQGPKTARVQARAALCAFSEGDKNAVTELNALIQKKVMYCLEHHRSMDIALATREELLLLSEVCSLADEFWESRLRVVFQLLFSSIKLGAKHPSISEHVILPCLRIISQACTPPKPDSSDKEQGGKIGPASLHKDDNSLNSSRSSGGGKSVPDVSEKNWDGSQKTHDIQLLSYSEWEKGASYLDFVRRHKVSQVARPGQRSRPQRYEFLALKYALRWKRRACKTGQSEIASFELGSWVTELVLSACSQSIRSEMCMLISLLCAQSSSRRFRLLNLLMSLLPATLSAGENAAEYFDLLFKMIETEDARLFLTVRGCLTTICKLITQEVSNVESLERSLRIDISQGFILHKLIELLGKFLDIPNIRSRFMREQLLSEVLEALIVIRGLIVQKTKLISDCSRLLKDLLDSLLLENAENKKHFIQACIGGLQIHGEKRGRSNLIFIEAPVDVLVGYRPHQEEFIRGSMTKNPYSSGEIGPLMRDVKNKICNQLDLLGLIEDDYGMELLVAGNIISLDLSIAQVYELVWKKSSSQSTNAVAATLLSSNAATSARDSPPMTVTYRLQDHLPGVMMVATRHDQRIDEDREESQDPEVEFAIANAVRECSGLETLLEIVQRLRDDLKSNQEQLVAVLNLLMLCCKIRENRRALLRLGALSLLLEIARRAFSVDAIEPAEGILLIVESLTMEANESDNINIAHNALTVSNEEAGAGEQAKKIVLMFLERLSHPVGLKKSNKQQRNTEMVARILPYLTYGEPAAMEALCQHFDPYLKNWVEFDQLLKQNLENPKDETVSLQASKQRFAVENFVRVSESMKTSSCGERLKDIILENGITEVAVRHLKDSFVFTGEAGFKSSPEWHSGLKLPSVPLILSMLRGLSMGHLATQKCIDEGGILPLLHALEGVSGENDIGARAENLLDTLSDTEGKGDGFLAEKVLGLRNATRDEMRRLALMKRKEMLQGLGMRQELASDGGKRIVVAQPILEGLEEMEEEEEGLACMVCREGYSLRPTDLLGVYTFSKRVNLGVGTSGSARGDCVYTTVSHFNIIHFQCHQEAKRADAALKTPKKEWDGAALRNNETLCNNLFPIRGPAVPLTQYTRYVDQYWDYLNGLGRADGSRLRLLTYDIVLMLARFATGASFSTDSRGGGKESNAKFLPFMIQMARYFVDHDSSHRNNLAKSVGAYLASSTSTSTPDTKSPTSSSAGTEETVQFMMVSSLLSESYESWLQHRRAFLQRGIYHAYMQRTHGRSSHRSSSSSSPSPSTPTKPDAKPEELLTIIQPMLVYTGLIEQLQHYFKVQKKGVGQSGQTREKDEKNLEGWELAMKDKLLNVNEMVGFSKEMLSWLDDMTSATDLQEAFDVIGVLGDVMSTPSGKCEDFVYAAIEAGKG